MEQERVREHSLFFCVRSSVLRAHLMKEIRFSEGEDGGSTATAKKHLQYIDI